MNTDEIIEILQEHKNHLIKCKREDNKSTLYWIGAIDCVDNLAIELGVELE